MWAQIMDKLHGVLYCTTMMKTGANKDFVSKTPTRLRGYAPCDLIRLTQNDMVCTRDRPSKCPGSLQQCQVHVALASEVRDADMRLNHDSTAFTLC